MNEARFVKGFLSLNEMYDETVETELIGDILVCVASAEPRCREITRVKQCSFDSTVLIDFDTHRGSGRKDQFLSELHQFLSASSNKITVLDGIGINDFNEWAQRLRLFLHECRLEKGSPLRIAIDISCLPKHYLIYLFGICIEEALVNELIFVYAEGVYKSVGSQQPGDILNKYSFSEGRWTSIVIPYFEGMLPIEKQTRMVASLGFEGLQSRNFINAYQADQYAVVLPSRAPNEAYDAIADRESRALLAEICLPADNIWKCRPSSALDVLKHIDEGLKRSVRFQDIFVCLGTKPHAIGMALHALIERETTVVCRMPKSYPENATEASGRFFLYHVTDLSSIPQLARHNLFEGA